MKYEFTFARDQKSCNAKPSHLNNVSERFAFLLYSLFAIKTQERRGNRVQTDQIDVES